MLRGYSRSLPAAPPSKLCVRRYPPSIWIPSMPASSSISGDKIAGFVRDPFAEVAPPRGCAAGDGAGIADSRHVSPLGTIRRVRRTLLATNLAEGALVAWRRFAGGNGWMRAFRFSVSTRSFFRPCGDSFHRCQDFRQRLQAVDHAQGSDRFFLDEHCQLLARLTGAESFRLHAGEGHLAARGRARPPQVDRTGRPGGPFRGDEREWER